MNSSPAPAIDERIEQAKARLGEHWVGHPARRIKRLPRPITAPTVLVKRNYQPKTKE